MCEYYSGTVQKLQKTRQLDVYYVVDVEGMQYTHSNAYKR